VKSIQLPITNNVKQLGRLYHTEIIFSIRNGLAFTVLHYCNLIRQTYLGIASSLHSDLGIDQTRPYPNKSDKFI
jgi:hypothetical protein